MDKKRKISSSLIALDSHGKSGMPFTPVAGATKNKGSYASIIGATTA